MPEFYELTPVEFYHALETRKESMVSNFKAQERSHYSVARWQIMHMWNMKDRKLKRWQDDPTKFMPFEWEKVEKIPQTIQQMKQQLIRIANHFKARKK